MRWHRLHCSPHVYSLHTTSDCCGPLPFHIVAFAKTRTISPKAIHIFCGAWHLGNPCQSLNDTRESRVRMASFSYSGNADNYPIPFVLFSIFLYSADKGTNIGVYKTRRGHKLSVSSTPRFTTSDYQNALLYSRRRPPGSSCPRSSH